MKRKIFSVLFALVLVCSFSLVAAVPVAASPGVSGVSVELYNASDDAYDKANDGVTYYIYFTPGADLTANVDTITVRFPAGTSGFAFADTWVDPDGDSAHYGETRCTLGMVPGYNLQVTTPKKISAGTEAYLMVTGITNPTWATDIPTTKAHTLVLYTSQETTEITSAAYTLGNIGVITTVTLVAMDPADDSGDAEIGTAGAADDWRVTFVATTALVVNWGTITVTFPPDVYVPSPISKANILVDVDVDGDFVNGIQLEETPNIVGQSVTLEVPTGAAIGNGEAAGVWFKEAAGIKNPTLANTDSGNEAINTGDYIGKVKTSTDSGIMRDVTNGFAGDVGPASPCVLGIKAGSPTRVVAGKASGTITIQSKDTYGNLSNVPALVTVAISSSSTTGTFLGDADGDGDFTDGDGIYDDSTTGIELGAHEGIFKYKDSAVGTATITASYAAMDWTPATWDIEVMTANVVYLYDGTDLIETYPTITAALANAMPGQTVKVTAGTYSEDSDETFPITISTDSVTLESIDGAATTIIEGPATIPSANGIIKITAVSAVLGGSSSGFTIKGKTGGSTYAAVLFVNFKPTIQGNILTGELTGDGGAIKDITGEHGTGSLLTIRDNIINTTVKNTVAVAMWLYPGPGSIIDNNEVSGFVAGIVLLKAAASPFPDSWANAVTVSNNTVHGNSDVALCAGLDFIVFRGNDCYDNLHGIKLSTNSDYAKVVGNDLYNNEGSGLWVGSAATAEDVYVFGNNIYGNTATVGTVTTDDYGIWNEDTGSDVPAKHNWWGDASGPYHATTNPTGTGDKVDTVTYSPWLTAPIVKGAAAFSHAVATLTGQTTAGVDVSGAFVAPATRIGAARYTVNPRLAITEFTPLAESFFDVFVEEAVPVTGELITINFYPSGVTADSVAWYWSTAEGAWVKCSEQDYSAVGFVWVKCRHEASVTPPATLPTAEGLAVGVQFVIGTEEAPVTLVSISALPESVILDDVGETQQITVTATYDDASTADVTATSAYASDDETVATVSTGGLITAVAEGDATITVSYETETDTVSVTVGFDPLALYDENNDGVIDKPEALTAVTDYFAGDITKAQALEVIALYFAS